MQARRSIQLVKEAKDAAPQARRPEGSNSNPHPNSNPPTPNPIPNLLQARRPEGTPSAAATAALAEDGPPPLEAFTTSLSHDGRPEAEVD